MLENLVIPNWLVAEFWPLLALIVLDVVLGVMRAVKQGYFNWARVGDFYRTMIVPKLGSWVAMAALNIVLGESFVSQAAVHGTFLIIIASVSASVKENFSAVFGSDSGINLP
jgi:hypothetical protein